MPIPIYSVGQVLGASDVNTWLVPLAALKLADESVTSSTALQNDDVLLVALAASATYAMTMYLDYEGGTSNSSDLKIGWTVPAGTVMRYTALYQSPAGVSNQNNVFDQTNTISMLTNGATSRNAMFWGTVVSSSTTGNLQLQWAQNTSSGTATKVHAKSWLILDRIA